MPGVVVLWKMFFLSSLTPLCLETDSHCVDQAGLSIPPPRPPKSCDYRYHTSLCRVFETESMPQAKLNRIRFRKILLEQKSSQEHISPQIKVSKCFTVFAHTKTNYPNLKTSELLTRVKHTPHVPEQTDTW